MPQPLEIIGAEGQNRTADTGIFSPLLYRLSYLGMTLKESKIIRPPFFCQDFFLAHITKKILQQNARCNGSCFGP